MLKTEIKLRVELTKNRSLVIDGLEAARPCDFLRQAPPLEQESSGLLYCLCLMEAGTEGSFGKGARGIMQIQCHDHPMQARCASGYLSSSAVSRSGTGGYLILRVWVSR